MRLRALALVLALALTACGPSSKEDLVAKAREVKTRAELERVLGKPDDVTKLGPLEKWTYRAKNGEVVFVLVGDTVNPRGDRARTEAELEAAAGKHGDGRAHRQHHGGGLLVAERLPGRTVDRGPVEIEAPRADRVHVPDGMPDLVGERASLPRATEAPMVLFEEVLVAVLDGARGGLGADHLDTVAPSPPEELPLHVHLRGGFLYPAFNGRDQIGLVVEGTRDP